MKPKITSRIFADGSFGLRASDVFEHDGKPYGPTGLMARLDGATTAEHNQHVEREELAWLHTSPEKLFLYVRETPPAITTWLGMVVSSVCRLGPSRQAGGFNSSHVTKRAVDCRIFGVRYVGWYFDSAGNYCRLRKAKRQAESGFERLTEQR